MAAVRLRRSELPLDLGLIDDLPHRIKTDVRQNDTDTVPADRFPHDKVFEILRGHNKPNFFRLLLGRAGHELLVITFRNHLFRSRDIPILPPFTTSLRSEEHTS